jgi:undecaprenyl-diphosphatase
METNPDVSLLRAVLLGLIQGLTEFLPVSSSGHLALAENLIPGFREPGILLDVMLHVGTLVAVVIYYRREILELLGFAWSWAVGAGGGARTPTDGEAKKLIWGIIIASVPTAVIGLLIEHRVEAVGDSVGLTGLCLLGTAAILVGGELASRRVKAKPGHPDFLASFLIGVAQGIAVIPGISRSGSTIAAARALGTPGPEAARFSFLISIPAIGGAALLTAVKERDKIMAFTGAEALAAVVGPLVAGVVGFLAIGAMMRLISRGGLWWFAGYCALAGTAALVYNML